MGEQRMKQDARHTPLFKYFEKVFGLNFFRARVPAFEKGLIIGDTLITPDMARFFFAAATPAEAPPLSAARVPVDNPPEPNPPADDARAVEPDPPKQAPLEKKPRRGQEQNKEDPSALEI